MQLFFKYDLLTYLSLIDDPWDQKLKENVKVESKLELRVMTMA